MGFSDNQNSDAELNEIEREIEDIQFDLQSNSDSILVRPKEMKTIMDDYIHRIEQNSQKLYFFKKSNSGSLEIYKRIGELEKKMAILKNQIEINLKMLKKL